VTKKLIAFFGVEGMGAQATSMTEVERIANFRRECMVVSLKN
jgi:hypothetical protein